MPQVRIRLLKTHDEYRQCERIQRQVWGTLGVAGEAMTVTQEYGGVVLGAFEGKMLVAFLYAFLARRRGRLVHWSHMMAVLPGRRDRGLGLRLKLAHRRLALKRGLKSICWTFDPLQTRNAALNLSRLGARVEEYVRDVYGRFPSRIERGLMSDRFVVNWRIASPGVARRLRQAPYGTWLRPASYDGPPVNETRLNAQGLLENQRISLHRRGPRLLVEIPSNTDEMRRRSLRLARRWRLETRRIFERYLATGYRVADFLPPSAATAGRCFYILRHGL